MATVKKRPSFFDSEEGAWAKNLLEEMMTDTSFTTDTSYSADTIRYPSNRIPFVDKHMNYMSAHSAMDPHHYMANLRLRTRVR